ncbi:hypothetical protein HELRODRAFT_87830 [Helobdella robusta]|uniref:Hexosyltransferase n=1 Tax=Helobdella robusta TaxID=6412 RepID=T1G6W0_HELRO|nr:hypothetical protein HELRODRAFT_87830 [Helobdella robusta]ESN94124.1 hypothetical protein HELRODRAFT_87830 [Helobdella robusta]
MKKLFAIVYVHSAPGNYKRRQLIRETWGNPIYHICPIKILFFIGLPKPKEDTQWFLKQESDTYKDIIQENYYDDYHNLTYKAVGAMKWVSEYCSHARFIIKTDDDIVVNIFLLFNYLDKQMLTTNTIFCRVWSRMLVMREGKWKVDVEDYPDELYPRYCSGSAFVMTSDLAQKLYNTSHYVPFFWVDDAYLTGFLPRKLTNVTHVSLQKYYHFQFSLFMTGSTAKKFMFIHSYIELFTRKLWRDIVKLEVGSIS